MNADPPAPGPWPRGYRVLLAAVVAVAVTGYFAGLRESRRLSQRGVEPPIGQADVPSGEAPLAPTYRDLGRKDATSRGGVHDFSALPSAEGAAPAEPPTDAEVEQALAERMLLRAFDGAPPVMPHPISGSDASCLICHVDGKRVGDRVARRMSHSFLAACTQCHVEQKAAADSEFANLFQGLLPSARGERAAPGAPPAVPHSLWMRHDCLSCHGPAGPAALRTTHPERLGCMQCHPAGSPLDFVPTFSEKVP